MNSNGWTKLQAVKAHYMVTWKTRLLFSTYKKKKFSSYFKAYKNKKLFFTSYLKAQKYWDADITKNMVFDHDKPWSIIKVGVDYIIVGESPQYNSKGCGHMS